MSDTPETDHLEVQLGQAATHSHPILWEHSRKMERERDEARNDLDNMQDQRDLAMKVISRLERERDEAIDYSKATWQTLRDSQDEVLRLTFENREVTQDLDKARDAIMKVEEIFVDGENTHDDWFKMGSIAREYFKK